MGRRGAWAVVRRALETLCFPIAPMLRRARTQQTTPLHQARLGFARSELKLTHANSAFRAMRLRGADVST